MAQRKESKTKIRVRDLKPKKDAKGGVSVDVTADVSVSGHNVNRGVSGHSIQRPGRGDR